MKLILILILVCFVGNKEIYGQKNYDLFTGKPLDTKRFDLLAQQNLTSVCSISVAPCTRREGRRVDGTCNNLRHPSRGAGASPLLRLLPADFGKDGGLRPAKDGSPLPLARRIRTSLFSDGLVVHAPHFTSLLTHFLVTTAADTTSLLDIITYVVASDCCTPAGSLNPRCIPIVVPDDDPYLRLTDVRCMNLTRHVTFQELGCVSHNVPAARYSVTTPLLDLSQVYGYTTSDEKRVRLFKGGLLKFEVRQGRVLPPSDSAICINNQLGAGETTCNHFGDNFGSNTLLTVVVVVIWLFREHNRIAGELQRLNPCWDDERLFSVARQINIAQYQHIYLYELVPAIMGKENAIHSGIISTNEGFVDDYDDRVEPGSFVEFITATRYFHALQDGRTKYMGKYLGFRNSVFDEFRGGVLELNNTIEQLTQGSFRQPSALFIDNVLDRDLVEKLYGGRQTASDIASIDIMRGRDLGIKSYNDYRKLCGLPIAHKFEDFTDVIDVQKVEILSRIYEDPDDVDFMVGVYLENFVKGSVVGPTLYCVLTNQYLRWKNSDRFWYEHSDQETSLTLQQLLEIRKSSIARLLCDDADKVTKIQPQAFYHVRDGNEMLECENIPKVDLRAWTDSTCHKLEDEENSNKQKISSSGF